MGVVHIGFDESGVGEGLFVMGAYAATHPIFGEYFEQDRYLKARDYVRQDQSFTLPRLSRLTKQEQADFRWMLADATNTTRQSLSHLCIANLIESFDIDPANAIVHIDAFYHPQWTPILISHLLSERGIDIPTQNILTYGYADTRVRSVRNADLVAAHISFTMSDYIPYFRSREKWSYLTTFQEPEPSTTQRSNLESTLQELRLAA